MRRKANKSIFLCEAIWGGFETGFCIPSIFSWRISFETLRSLTRSAKATNQRSLLAVDCLQFDQFLSFTFLVYLNSVLRSEQNFLIRTQLRCAHSSLGTEEAFHFLSSNERAICYKLKREGTCLAGVRDQILFCLRAVATGSEGGWSWINSIC